jgi:hypothetical protein
MLSVHNMYANFSGGESLNASSVPSRDLLETDVFDIAKSVRAKYCCHATWLESVGQLFPHFLKLCAPLPFLFS